MNKHHYVVIMAGGIGSRFWPKSRQDFPKQFLDILNSGKTLIQWTYERFNSFIPPENIYVVTSQEYSKIVKDQLPELPLENILGEPSRKNTAPCIAYISFKLLKKDPKASLLVVPSDHLILDKKGFVKVCLGSERDTPFNGPRQRLLTEMTSWLGTPYKYGGENRTGIDCSGFVMQAYRAIGFNLDHGSDYLRTCKQGAVIHDELRYGDILVFPGHCAIYAGNGRTFETVDQTVGRNSIWGRDQVVVRRMLDVPKSDIDTKSFASRSKSKRAKKVSKG